MKQVFRSMSALKKIRTDASDRSRFATRRCYAKASWLKLSGAKKRDNLFVLKRAPHVLLGVEYVRLIIAAVTKGPPSA